MRYIISALIWFIGTILTLSAFFAAFVISRWPFPVADRVKKVHAQCFWWADYLIAMNPFWKVKVTGLENIDHKKTYVIVANHQSLADIIIIYKTRAYFKWVAKKSLLKIPGIGGLLWVNDHILLERGEFGSIKEVYRKAAERLREGVSVCFFPEGTRSNTDEMGEFQNGAFKLAIKEGKNILPIYIGGTREAIPKGGWVFNAKVSGRLVVLPEIKITDYAPADFAKLRDFVRGQLDKVAHS